MTGAEGVQHTWWRRLAARWRPAGPAAAVPGCPLILEHLLRVFPGPLAYRDPAGAYVLLNDAMARRLGLRGPAEAVGKTDVQLARLRPTAGQGEPEPGSVSVTPVHDEHGTPLGTLVVGSDARERDAAERRARALEDERDVLRTVLDHLPDQVYAKDHQHRFVVANAAVARKITGSADSSLVLGKSDHDFFPKPDADRYRADEARLMASGKTSVELEERALYQGRTYWNQTTKVVLRDAEGQVVGLAGLNRDITSKKAAEEALAAERSLLDCLMDNIPDGIYFKDAEGRFLRANQAQAALFGLADPARLVGRRLAEIQPGEAARAAESEEREILRSARPVVGKLEAVRDGRGGRVWLLSTKVPFRDAESRVAGLVAIARDVTERKQAEEALEASLKSFLAFANRVADGDLTPRASEGSDTVGRIAAAVNSIVQGFSGILAGAKAAVGQVAVSAKEILSASRYIADGAERQSVEVRRTSDSVEAIAASMQAVSRDAAAWAGSARDALSHVGTGDASVQRTAEAVDRIVAAVDQTADRMRLLAQRVSDISGIMDLIDDIASQSTLLSLNAAIQAAHAGEAGRAFDVVAEQIRSLAERSTHATRDVARIIETIQAETGEVVEATKHGSREVRRGRELAEQARAALVAISKAVAETVQLSESIAGASAEQERATRQLAQTMETIAGISQGSSSSAHETARTVQALVGLSRQLEVALGRFRIENESAPWASASRGPTGAGVLGRDKA